MLFSLNKGKKLQTRICENIRLQFHLAATTSLARILQISNAKTVPVLKEVFVCLSVFVRLTAPSARKDATVKNSSAGPASAPAMQISSNVIQNSARIASANQKFMIAKTIRFC